ncbi:GNAT family N-acetyltransferase [Deinococcus yavapaiensis]|uniref:Acetyltransferase (GNAT) family protein n=1 Tax=Deinococcus yavapaiensis KR-236 TaxID=694435 RepID=A0A318S973_9DEIO|nr:GNAT family N-acetyltransferase [Deinococcus yavapaiensis]PYE55680.1 acetyltransferase (GNAT) family protein [Deinococcus yavapaiensis KR-236]
MTSRFEVRVATNDDVRAASDVLQAAARFLIERGEPLWDPRDFRCERLARFVTSGELHVTREDGEVVGAFLLQREDELFWPHALRGEALYVHKLATHPDRAGRGAASAALRFALKRARDANCSFVRLDCAPHPRLCAFYERFGFRRYGTDLWRVGSFEAARYELRVS